MIDPFLKYIESKDLFASKDKLLVAVSGGVDSVVLAHLCNKARLDFAIAHCNFGLRGKDSDGDELFVKAMADNWNVPFYTKCFDTNTYSIKKGISIQMAARELRYDWFEKVSIQNDFRYVLVGTHLNDSIETFFLNATKGTGISGLRGILPKRDNIVRPLLFASKDQILEYAKSENLEWRNDSSNKSAKYERNKIRQDVIPKLKEINTAFESSFANTLDNISFAEAMFKRTIGNLREKFVSEISDTISVDIENLKLELFADQILYEFIHPLGFTLSDCKNILLSDRTGSEFVSNEYRAVLNRGKLLIQSQKRSIQSPVTINETTYSVESPISLAISKQTAPIEIPKHRSIGCFDLSKLSFPLELRPWRIGDAFYPLGMHGKKKVSDFLIDNKFSLLEKENTFVLTSGNEIIWIVGHRIDDRFKITPTTKNILKVELKND